jgi:hypothetical protein
MAGEARRFRGLHQEVISGEGIDYKTQCEGTGGSRNLLATMKRTKRKPSPKGAKQSGALGAERRVDGECEEAMMARRGAGGRE